MMKPINKTHGTYNSNTGKEMKKTFSIVGIGASAGGLEAMTQLLNALPANTGMGFVLIQHLDPTHESILVTLLAKATTMPVAEAKDNTHVKPNHVYVIPHDNDITITQGVLNLTNRATSDKPHMPINQFFRSLAESHHENAIGVILSGTGSDGAIGIKAIKHAGGITFAQDKTAKYAGMPKAAKESGYVDLVLPPGEIAQEITSMSSRPYLQRPKTPEDHVELPHDQDELTKIFFVLNKSSGIDFRHYKRAMINRRINRRMSLHKCTTQKEYIRYLKEHSDEVDALTGDLLINVTSFFRDPQTFTFLHNTIFPDMVKNRPQKEMLRIWVPGCATGEEVYSIAIALSEFLEERSLDLSFQIFGTDTSMLVIEKARLAIYTQKAVKNIPQKRLERYFERIDKNYQVKKFIRRVCVFAPHNVFQDPPFSRLDMISCCNLLIYLDAVLQNRILHTFHYALNSGGVLMLGKSETVGNSYEFFSQVEKKYKVYKRREIAPKKAVDLAKFIPQVGKHDANDTSQMNDAVTDLFDIQKQADRILMRHYTPASIIINNDLEIIQFHGSTGTYLEPSPGKASFNLMKMAREGLAFELRSAISQVKKNGTSFKKEGIHIKQHGMLQRISIEIVPLKSTDKEPYYLVIFIEDKELPLAELSSTHQENHGVKNRRIEELEQRLAQTHEDMRSITEEQETTNEELQMKKFSQVTKNYKASMKNLKHQKKSLNRQMKN